MVLAITKNFSSWNLTFSNATNATLFTDIYHTNYPTTWAIVNTVIHVCSLLTNLTFVFVVIADKTSLAGPRLLILNLALCGLVLSAGWFPATTLVSYFSQQRAPTSCAFFAGTIFFVTATNWADVPIAINRMVAICYPHHYRPFNSKKISLLMIVASWCVGLIPAILTTFRMGAMYAGRPYGHCLILPLGPYGRIFGLIPSVIPFCIVGILSIMIFVMAYMKTRAVNSLEATGKRLIKRRLNIAKAMLASVVWHVVTSFPIIFFTMTFPQIISQQPWLSAGIRGSTSLEFAISPVSRTKAIHLLYCFSA